MVSKIRQYTLNRARCAAMHLHSPLPCNPIAPLHCPISAPPSTHPRPCCTSGTLLFRCPPPHVECWARRRWLGSAVRPYLRTRLGNICKGLQARSQLVGSPGQGKDQTRSPLDASLAFTFALVPAVVVVVAAIAVGCSATVGCRCGCGCGCRRFRGVRGIGEGVCVVWHGVERCWSCWSCWSRTTTSCLSVFGVQPTAKGTPGKVP